MRLPVSLAPDRNRRNRKLVTLRIVRHVSLAAGASRVEIRTEVENAARDHRLRVHFPLPGACRESVAGGTFEIVRRGVGPEILPPRPTRGGVASDLSQEQPAATHPFTGFVAAPWSDAGAAVDVDVDAGSGASGTLAVLSRGSREYEVLDARAQRLRRAGTSELAVTLFRSVGWLSRADLASRSGHAGMDIPTPGAQEQGRLTFEYAVTTQVDPGPSLPDEWEDYRSPAEVVAQAPGGAFGPERSLLDIQGTGISFSSLTRAPSGCLQVRFFEHQGKGGRTVLRFHSPLRSARKTRIDGTRLGDLPLADDARSALVAVAPYEIVTVELAPADKTQEAAGVSPR
jgi:alpha-mannosidase